jgi:hypothetical protein
MTGMSGGGTFTPPSLGGMAGMPGGPMVGAPGGPPTSPMMGGIASSGGGSSMMRPPMMGGMASAGGGSSMMRPPMMGGMASAGGGSSMMGPPMMGGMASAGGSSRLPGLGGMGPMGGAGSSSMMRPPMMGGNPRMGGGSLGIGAEMPGSDMSAGAMGGPMGGAMGGMMGGGTAVAGGGVQAGEGEVSWVYEKKTTTHVFLFNSEGRVIQIQSFGYKAGARTVNGIGLGDTAARIYRVYGFPEETQVSGSTRTLDYSKRANVAFQLADQGGKGLRVVGITVALVKAPDPENPE